MKYDFDSIISREGTYSVKWEEANEGEIPLWIADMEFLTAPCIQEAIKERANHGIFGYSTIPKEWAASYQSWWSVQHNFLMDKDDIIFCTGVVPAISTAVRKFTTPAEKVVILTPVYNIFFNSIVNNGRRVLECPLLYDGTSYNIDFDELEKKLSDPLTTMLIFCNPHNPVGKIWTKEDLAKVGELCKKHNVVVVSDEIHCDITKPNSSYIPFATASQTCKDISITCIAPTKAFNIAGINTAAVYISNKGLKDRMIRALNTDEIAEPNSFAIVAAIAAFTKGKGWLTELCEYIEENKKFASGYIQNNIPLIKPLSSDATYLMWLDCKAVNKTSNELVTYFKHKANVRLASGSSYGDAGEGFLRMNVACPRSMLNEALERIKCIL